MGVDAEMLVKTRQAYTPQQVRALSVDLAEAFGHDQFWIWDDFEAEDGTIGRHALELVTKYEQDGDDILPEAGETFIRVHIATRYYGEGYERGDLPLIIAVAEWLESRIADADVFYGGDSSGICAEPFDASARRHLFAYFCRVGHKPYRGGFGVFGGNGNVVRCEFCATDMESTGGGRDREFFYCAGCGKKVVAYNDGRPSVIVPKGKDFFDMRDLEAQSPTSP